MAAQALPGGPALLELPSIPAPVKEFIPYLSQNPDKSISSLVEPYKAYESELRKFFAQQPDHEVVKDGAVNLVPIFSGHETELKMRTRDLASETQEQKEKYIMPLKNKDRRPNGSPAVVASLKDFQTNFNLFSESSLADLDWNNVVAAGSAVTTSLIPLPEKWSGSKRAMREYYHEHLAPASDVDLFLYGLTEEEGLEKIKQIETKIKDAILHETTTIRTKNAITIASQHPTRHVQIVLRLYDSISQIITGFDVDCSCAAYDGSQVYMSPRAVGAFVTQCNTIDLTRRSPSYENRLSKYSHRGFEVHWPMLDRSRIDPTIFERSFGRTEGLARLLILEKLPKQADRENYMDQRRQERGRPALNRRFRSQRRLHGNLKDQEEDEVAEWAEQDDIADYHTMTVPYGPKYNAAKINRLLYAKDLLLNAEWNQPEDRTVYLHRHPCFFGTAEEIIHDCCGYCPVPTTDEEKEVAEKESKTNVSGTLKFIVDDPGRQEIGSFNPITDDEWTTMSYVGDTARLCQAIVDGDLEHVQDWCSQEGVDVNRRDFTGRTPLHLATLASTPEIVKCLVDNGARMIARLVDGRTALHIAAARGNREMIRILMDKSLANEEEEQQKEEARLDAKRKAAGTKPDIEEGSDSASEITLDSDQEASDAMTMGSFVKIPKEGEGEGAKEIADVLDESEEDPDVYDINVIAWDYGLSPLHLAIMNGHLDIIELLVSEYGADVLLPVKLVEAGTTNQKGAVMSLVLAMSLPNDQAKGVVKLLLKLGATSGQSDMNHITALHYIVAQDNSDLLDILFENDGPIANRVLNKHGMTNGWSRQDTPLTTSVELRHEEMVMKLLKLGAKPEIQFDDWIKNYLADNSYARTLSTDENRKQFQQTVMQPIIAAICKESPAIVKELLAHGADLQTLTNYGWEVANDPSKGRYSSWQSPESILDVIRNKLETLREWKEPISDRNWKFGYQSLDYEPETLKDAEYYIKDTTPGTYQHWYALRSYLTEKASNAEQHSNYRKGLEYRDEQMAQYKSNREAINKTITLLEETEKELVAAGAKTFHELYPKIKLPKKDKRHNHDSDKEIKPPAFKVVQDFQVPDLNERKRKGYVKLFEAVWDNDLETIKELTLRPWKYKENEQPPLSISIQDSLSYSPFSIAILRGHLDLARKIVDICVAQYDNSGDNTLNKTRQRWAIDVDEDLDVPIYSELISDKFTIDALEEVANTVKSDVSPLQMITYESIPGRFIDGEKEDNKRTDNLDPFLYAVEKDDLKLFKFLLELATEQSALLAKHEEDQRCYNVPQYIFYTAIDLGRTQMLAEIIKCSGFGIPWTELTAASGVEIKTKPRYYEGLTIGGKKRKDWAAPPSGAVTSKATEESAPPLIRAAQRGSVESVEWFMSDAPMRRYKEFAEANKSDIRVRSLEKGKGFDKTVSQWLNTKSDLLLHSAILYNPRTDDEENKHLNLIKHIVSVSPESMLSHKSSNGYSPLHLAVSKQNIPIIKYLLSVGASSRSRDKTNKNIIHTLVANGSTFENKPHKLDEFLQLFDKKDVMEMMLERCNDYPSALTPMALWLQLNSAGKPDILEVMMKYSTGEELEMINGEGDLPLHVAIKKNLFQITPFLISRNPSLIHRESATGRTPLEMSQDKYISTFLNNAPNVLNDFNYSSNNMSSFTLSSQWGSKAHAKSDKDETRSVWEECLRVQGELKRKRSGDGDGASEDVAEAKNTTRAKRRLVTLFEANEVARRLANGVGGGSNYGRRYNLRSSRIDDLM